MGAKLSRDFLLNPSTRVLARAEKQKSYCLFENRGEERELLSIAAARMMFFPARNRYLL
jgi:hypothetical protein